MYYIIAKDKDKGTLFWYNLNSFYFISSYIYLESNPSCSKRVVEELLLNVSYKPLFPKILKETKNIRFFMELKFLLPRSPSCGVVAFVKLMS